MSVTQQSDEFIENLVSEMPELTYHYTARQQARYMKESKENLLSEQCTILQTSQRFIYSFIIQDSVQGFHWAKNQAFLHTFFIYIKDQHLQTLSFSVVFSC
jgi:hypothetical protein